MRELAYTEISGLKECLDELAAHHNEVSANFPGQYPKRPAEETLKGFEKDVLAGRSRIAVVESEGRILGFCKADLDGADGAVGYLIVRKNARGKGYGDLLLTWALDKALLLLRDGSFRSAPLPWLLGTLGAALVIGLAFS